MPATTKLLARPPPGWIKAHRMALENQRVLDDDEREQLERPAQ